MKKTYIYILIVILVIAAGVVVGVILKDDTSKETASGNVASGNDGGNKIIVNQTINQNINSTEEENQNGTDNNIAENPVEDAEEWMPKTDLEKALYIAAQEWGEDGKVKFVFEEETPEGEYIICVREIETTNALMWYKVNIQTETCEEW